MVRITKQGSNEAGAWKFLSDGTEYRYITSTNKTYISTLNGDEIVEGRVGC